MLKSLSLTCARVGIFFLHGIISAIWKMVVNGTFHAIIVDMKKKILSITVFTPTHIPILSTVKLQIFLLLLSECVGRAVFFLFLRTIKFKWNMLKWKYRFGKFAHIREVSKSIHSFHMYIYYVRAYFCKYVYRIVRTTWAHTYMISIERKTCIKENWRERKNKNEWQKKSFSIPVRLFSCHLFVWSHTTKNYQ